jgi:predicted aconitase with swiveling domain
VISGVCLVPGESEGAPLILAEPLSFWGGFDPGTGTIIDRWHPQAGASIAGRVLMMPGGRGSCSGSAALAEAVRLGNGPAAILLSRRDPIVIVGAIVAAELYGTSCPVALVEDFRPFAGVGRVRVRGEGDAAGISVLS